MKKSVFVFAVVCGFALVSLPGQTLRAQDREQAGKEDDSQTRGRFLRRLRDDIRSMTGADENEKEKDREKSQQRDSADSRTPTPAARPTGSGDYPNPGRYDGVSMPQAARANPLNPGAGFRMSDLLPSQQAGPTAAQSNPPRKGFGLTLEESGERLVVDSLARNGNAAEADFRRGDVILEIGGVPVTSISEFDEITGILTEGDQIEVSISRGGKEEKKLLQLGSVPEAAATPAPEALRSPSLAPSSASDFVPNYESASDARFARQQQGATFGGLGGSVMESGVGPQQTVQNSAAILQMQETIRRQQVVIEQLQRELQTLQGSNRRRN